MHCGKEIFLHLSAILFTGAGVSVPTLIIVQWGLCSGWSLSRGVSVWGSLHSGISEQRVSVQGVSTQEGLCPGGFSARETTHMVKD